MKATARHLQLLLTGLWAVACFSFYQWCYPYHFFYKEQNQLFLWSTDYVVTYLEKPAWLVCLAGDFLTQFYYYLYAGATLLTLTLLTLLACTNMALRRVGLSRWWAFAIAVLLTTAEAALHLHHAFRLSSTMALIGGLLLFLRYSQWWHHPHHRWEQAFQGLLVLVTAWLVYWLFGYGTWVFLLLCAMRCATRESIAAGGIVGGVTVFLLLSIPLTKSYYLLPVDKLYGYPGIGTPRMPEWYLEKQLSVDCEYYFGNFNKVTSLVEQEPHPTPEMLFFYNLVMAQRGQLPDALLKYTPNELGTFYKIGPDTPLMTIKNMNELYYALGDMTFTERAAMMSCVFSPDNRNNRMVKRLAETALVSGDTLASKKFLGLLERTFVWRKWAKEAPQSAQYAAKKRFRNQQDTLSTSDNAHFIMMQLLDSNPRNEVVLDYILCSTLLLKDIDSFKRDYDRYCSERPRLKKIYQEALCVWLAGHQAPPEEWQHYIKQDDVFQRFVQYNRQRGSTAFRDTYWYYFDTVKAPKP